LNLKEDDMPFSTQERDALLAVKGIGPTVIQRLEQMGFSSLEQLALADALEIVTTAAGAVGSTCWKNSPQARSAIQSAINKAKAWR
jgi:predicted RecB family nuclease